jgi:putative toxin-antitoxin system antitoxin component (TIGR02293 family)
VASTAQLTQEILGIETTTEPLVDLVREGLPVASFAAVASHTGLSREALGRVADIPVRTVQRRKGRLQRDESDRLTRIARIYAQAASVFGSRDAAERWMTTPNWALDGRRPLEMLDTEVAAREVEDTLGRIEDGTFA